jgi:hypothetical protein
LTARAIYQETPRLAAIAATDHAGVGDENEHRRPRLQVRAVPRRRRSKLQAASRHQRGDREDSHRKHEPGVRGNGDAREAGSRQAREERGHERGVAEAERAGIRLVGGFVLRRSNLARSFPDGEWQPHTDDQRDGRGGRRHRSEPIDEQGGDVASEQQ